MHKFYFTKNKPIAYRTNRKLGGEAPSKYLKAIQDTNVAADVLDENLRTHVIDVASLRADNFQSFFICRAKALLELIGRSMGKQIVNLDSSDVIQAFGAPLN